MKSLHPRRRRAAFTLVEVALAMGVASFCLIAVLGLVPLGVNTAQVASDQTTAGSILSHVLTDLRSTQSTVGAGAPTSPQYQVQIPSATNPVVLYFGDSAQQFSSAPTVGTSRYRLTITFLPSSGLRKATGATLVVSWPARIDPGNPASGTPAGRVQVFAALDRN